jgi:Bacteriocin-protection, YdeI or OmpD-Associated
VNAPGSTGRSGDSSGSGPDRTRRFVTEVTIDNRGRTHVRVPFDPDEVWGPKPRHLVSGSLDGCSLRGEINGTDVGHELVLGPVWTRDSRARTGRSVEVILTPEGPQRSDLAPDIAAALDASPQAGAFFDSLAQFYRNAYLQWINATKRHPEQRPLRVAEMIRLLEEGKKERPRS